MRYSNCHPDKRYFAKGLCAKCYCKKTHDRRQKDPEIVKKNRARALKWRKDNPERTLLMDTKKQLFRKYGITLEKYNEMLSSQDFVCKICKKPETIKTNIRTNKLAVDHCHSTGKVRDLLCMKCNTVLSHIEKTGTEHFDNYLKRHADGE